MQPKIKSNELIERLEALKYKDRSTIGFPLRKIESEAMELLEKNAADAYSILGMVATLRGNLDQMYSNFKTALNISPNSSNILGNYGTSLREFCRYDESIEYYIKAYSFERGDEHRLDQLIGSCFLAGRFSLAFEYVLEAKKLNIEKLTYSEDLITKAFNTVKSQNISEEYVVELIKIANTILEENSLLTPLLKCHVRDGVEKNRFESIEFELSINGSEEKVSELQELLEDTSWERGLSEFIGDCFQIDYVMNNPTKTLEGELDRFTEEFKDPKNLVPVDQSLMDSIGDLVEGVEI